jgi:flavodoxin I
MKKILIAYASMTGNTEMMAESIADGIRVTIENVLVKDIIEIDVDDLLTYDGIILGAYTWISGSLPDELLDFYDDMESLDLSDKKAAVFGSGDTMYESFGAAVDILENRLRTCGADIIQQGLKIELTPTNVELEQCSRFGYNFAKQLEGI